MSLSCLMGMGLLLVRSLTGKLCPAPQTPPRPAEQPQRLTQGEQAYLSPAVVTTRSGTMWVFYQGGDPEDFNTHELFCRKRVAGQWSPEVRLTDNQYGDFNPSACQGPDGTLWLFWEVGQGNDYNSYEIQYRTFDGQRWSQPKPFTSNQIGDFSPSVVQTKKGVLWVFWVRGQGYDFSSYEVYYRTRKGSAWSEEQRFTRDEAIDFSPEAMEDQQGRLWLVRTAQRQGQLYVVCQSWDGDDEGWKSHGRITPDQPGGHFNPHILQDGAGRFWLTWDACEEDMSSFEVYWATSADGYQWSPCKQLTHSGWSRDAALGLDEKGVLWVFWTQGNGGRTQVLFAPLKE